MKKNRLRVWTAEEGGWTREEETGSGCGLLKKAVWTREEETGSGCGLLKKAVNQPINTSYYRPSTCRQTRSRLKFSP